MNADLIAMTCINDEGFMNLLIRYEGEYSLVRCGFWETWILLSGRK
jgi:hypothetical protein